MKPSLPLSLLAASALAGCVVGPNFQRPTPPAVTSYAPAPPVAATPQAADAQRIVPGMDVPARWWTLFRSPALDALVDQALANNPDAAGAEAALRQARELLYAQRGAYLPTVSLDPNVTRARTSAALAPIPSSNASLYTLYTAQVSVSYAPDVFGGVRRQVEAAAARAESQQFQTQAVYLTLTANIVQAALQEASLREQVAATADIVAEEQKLLDFLQQQHAAGQISGADVAAQQTALAQAEQSLPPLQKQLAQERDLLAALAACRLASAARMSGRRSTRLEGRPTGTSSGSCRAEISMVPAGPSDGKRPPSAASRSRSWASCFCSGGRDCSAWARAVCWAATSAPEI